MTTTKWFEPTRADGRSDRQVVFELVRDSDPGTLFRYDQLAEALSQGTTRSITRHVVGAAVRSANPTLLRECRRTLAVVKGIGYRIAQANEHLGLALYRKDRAETMIKTGVSLLRNVREDELTEPQRTLHNGQMLIMGGFYEALRSTRRRQDKHETVIKELVHRVSELERKPS